MLASILFVALFRALGRRHTPLTYTHTLVVSPYASCHNPTALAKSHHTERSFSHQHAPTPTTHLHTHTHTHNTHTHNTHNTHARAGSNNTIEAISLTKHAKEVGADACLIVNPYYNKPTQEGLYQHFKKIGEECDQPIVLYVGVEA